MKLHHVIFYILVFIQCNPDLEGNDHRLLTAWETGKGDTTDRPGDQLDYGFEKLPAWKQIVLRQLKRIYGVTPRFRFDDHLNNTCSLQPCAEEKFIQLLPDVFQFSNQLIQKNGKSFDILPAELALIFIMEGGTLVLNENKLNDINGYTELGVDTIVSNYANVKKWLHPSIQEIVNRRDEHIYTTTNDSYSNPAKVTTLIGLSLEEALYSTAGMYLYYKSLVNDALKGKLKEKPRLPQFFWTYYFFNAGGQGGVKDLSKYGFDYYQKPWSQTDNYVDWGSGYMRNASAKYNSTVRMAQLDYLAYLCAGNQFADPLHYVEPFFCQGLPSVVLPPPSSPGKKLHCTWDLGCCSLTYWMDTHVFSNPGCTVQCKNRPISASTDEQSEAVTEQTCLTVVDAEHRTSKNCQPLCQ